jgi:hypothetical protein
MGVGGGLGAHFHQRGHCASTGRMLDQNRLPLDALRKEVQLQVRRAGSDLHGSLQLVVGLLNRFTIREVHPTS